MPCLWPQHESSITLPFTSLALSHWLHPAHFNLISPPHVPRPSVDESGWCLMLVLNQEHSPKTKTNKHGKRSLNNRIQPKHSPLNRVYALGWIRGFLCALEQILYYCCLGEGKRLPPWFSGKEFSCNAEAKGDVGSIPGSGWSPGGGNGNPLQSFCLENPINRGAWRATVHGVAKSQMWLKRLSSRWGGGWWPWLNRKLHSKWGKSIPGPRTLLHLHRYHCKLSVHLFPLLSGLWSQDGMKNLIADS